MVQRITILFLLFSCFSWDLRGSTIDTLLKHHFDGVTDPTDTMVVFASGDDLQWVNYDQDGLDLQCIEGTTPGGWFWEGDLGNMNPSQSSNYALTSCSWAEQFGEQSFNWLISPKIFIPDSTYHLSWKSLSFLGPNYMDGYKVLVSEGSNIPEMGEFEDTLFVAAETLAALGSSTSLDLDDFIFSPGYIHANAYTDTAYFFKDYSQNPNKPFFHGRLEPHFVGLEKYAGKSVYVAFLHDTRDNEKMQLDDIEISNGTSRTKDISNRIKFEILPNPAENFAFIQWQLDVPQSIQLQVVNMNGQVLCEKHIEQSGISRYTMELGGLPSGMYAVRLSTQTGAANKILMKR